MDNAKIEFEIIEVIKINDEMETLLRQLYDKLYDVECQIGHSVNPLTQLMYAIDMFLSDEKIVLESE